MATDRAVVLALMAQKDKIESEIKSTKLKVHRIICLCFYDRFDVFRLLMMRYDCFVFGNGLFFFRFGGYFAQGRTCATNRPQ